MIKSNTLSLYAKSERDSQVTKEVPCTFENNLFTNTRVVREAPAPYDHFWHLRHIIAPDNNEQVVMMITGYFDESGTHQGSPVVCVAGYLSTVEQWMNFHKEWKEVLDEAGIKFFHMSEFESRRGMYKDWDQAKRIRFLEKLIDIILRRTIVGIAAAVLPSDYYEVITDERLEAHGSPYAFCANMCISYVAEWAKEANYNDPIAYVFEDGALKRNELREHFYNTWALPKARKHYRLGTLTLGGKEEFTQLQAADFLVYEMFKRVGHLISEKEWDTRKSLRKLGSGPITSRYFDKRTLLKFLSEIESNKPNENSK